MPTPVQVREGRVAELVAWARLNKVPSRDDTFGRLLEAANKLWPGVTRRTRSSYAESVARILATEPDH